jgi:hypothetical protein
VFVGRRHTIRRYLVCAMQGHFPVLVRTGAAELAVVFRTGAPHYGLPGTLATAWSADGGQRWSDPIEVAPRGDDVRNPALGVNAAGEWVLSYWKAGSHSYAPAADTDGEARWRGPVRGAADAEPDLFVVTSGDHGRTWSAPRPLRSARLAWCSPYGRIVAAPDGTLMMPAYGAPRDSEARRHDAIILRSRDGGLTWGDESTVVEHGSELALCWVSDDLLLGVARHAHGHCVLVRSGDGGRTWSEPVTVTRALEHPADLCRLAGSGELLLTFGRRRRPLGCGALLSDDGGLTWDPGREVLLAGDGIGNDLGYPSTVQLADGRLVTTLYFARGSAASDSAEGWGEVSCQALIYDEDLLAR